jgi:GMP synthase (glutamine-hydrolysing)
MSEPRLKSRLVVQALIRRAEVAGLVAMVMRSGDADAGAIALVVDCFAAGNRLFTQARDGDGRLVWAPADGGKPLDAPDLAERLERTTRRDPDLWILSIEDPKGLFDPNNPG